MQIVTEVNIGKTTPQEVMEFLMTLNRKKYRAWHPQHINFEWVRKTEELTGSMIRLKERLWFIPLNDVWEVIAYHPSNGIRLKSTNRKNTYFGLSFGIKNEANMVVQTIEIEHQNPKWHIEYNPFIKLFIVLYRKHTIEEYSELNK